MPGIMIDGSDVVAVYEATLEAAKRARSGHGPTIIEAMVERYLPHTSDDDDSRYRAREEIEAARKLDPLKILKDRLTSDDILSDDMDKRIKIAAKREIDEATDLVESTPYPGTEGFYDHVYAPPGGVP